MTDNSWPTVRLGDLCSVKHGFAFKSAHFSEEPGDIILTPGNFEARGGLKVRGEKDRSYTGAFPDEYRLNVGDLLIVMTDLTQEARILGAPALVPKTPGCLHNQRLGKIVSIDANRIELRFMYYLFNDRDFREALKSTASGSTVKHTSPSRIEAYRFRLPPLSTQNRIASILGAYDDLIEVNRRRIATLEEMARRLFEEWFVHYRYPGHEDQMLDKTKDGLFPRGWSRTQLGALCDEVRDGVMPSDVDENTPYVGLEHIPRRSFTLDDWGYAAEVTSTKLRFQKGDVLFGKIRPYFHKVAFAPFEGVSSSDAIVIRSRSVEWRGLVLSLISSDRFIARAVATSNGTKMPRANWNVLVRSPVAVPPKPLLELFNNAVLGWAELAATLKEADIRLGQSRDLLLPRLITGELSVAVAERELEAVA